MRSGARRNAPLPPPSGSLVSRLGDLQPRPAGGSLPALPLPPRNPPPRLPAARSLAEPEPSHSPRWSRLSRPAEGASAAHPWEGAAPAPSLRPGPQRPAFGAGR